MGSIYSIFTSIFSVLIGFMYSYETYPTDDPYVRYVDFNIDKLLIGTSVSLACFLIIGLPLCIYTVRKSNFRRTNYYNTVYYNSILLSERFEKKGINTYGAFPMEYTVLYLSDADSKRKTTSIRLNREKKIPTLYIGDKRIRTVRYFDLKSIENTEFLDQFISDLTYVENKVDMKRLFNDVYFSDQDNIVIQDYIIEQA